MRIIERLLCAIGLHDWLPVAWLQDRRKYFKRCGRHTCMATRVSK